jgi:ssDNA-specific exonuclease RecJ
MTQDTYNEIREVLKDVSEIMSKIEVHKDTIKETLTELSKKHNISKRQLNRMAKVYHKQNFMEECQEHEEFETLYENVMKNRT